MTSPGRCEVCGAPARARCKLCGRLVCDNHYDESTGLCVICKSTLCSLCNRNLAVTTCPICGRLVCRECSVEVSPGVRLCLECYSGLRGRSKAEILALLRRPRGMEAAASLSLRILPPPRVAGPP